MFDDGEALFDAVVSYGLEGIVAKRRAGLYRSGYRGWTKVKNPANWRRESEIELMQRRRETRGRRRCIRVVPRSPVNVEQRVAAAKAQEESRHRFPVAQPRRRRRDRACATDATG